MRFLVALVPLLSATLGACGDAGLGPGDSGASAIDAAPKAPTDAPRAIDAYPADTGLCELKDKPICLTNCTDRFPEGDAACRGGTWACPSGFKDSKTCPADACAVTAGQCCDLATGDLTQNPCPPDGGLRPPCPAGSQRGYSSLCIPTSLGVYDCAEVEGLPCVGEAHSCASMSRMGQASCSCPPAADGGTSNWRCAFFIP